MKKLAGYNLFWYCVYFFSFLVIRNKRKYAFGGPQGSFKDNAKYLFIYASEHCKDIDVAWITPHRSTERQLRAMGLKVYHWRSVKGIWFALTSRYWFYNSYSSDINFFLSGGATSVELWHGIGIKCIQYSITKGFYAQTYQHPSLKERIMLPQLYRRHDYVLSSTPLMTEMFSQSFRVPKNRCLELGYPRNAIVTVNEEERLDFIQRYEPEGMIELIDYMRRYSRVLLYMPTWRDSQRTLFTQHLDLDRLNSLLSGMGELMLLKPHPMVRSVGGDEERYSNLIFLDSMMDVYPLLPYVQVLVTDYSSILYDFLLMDESRKPDAVSQAFLYTYDYEEYVSEREFFYPFNEYVTGNRVEDFEGFLRCIENNEYSIDSTERKRLVQAFWGETAHYNSSQKIMDFFKTKR